MLNPINFLSILLVSAMASYFLIYEIVRFSKLYVKNKAPDNKKSEFEPKYPQLTRWFGVVEILIYTSSLMLGYPEFIAVWLSLKVAGNWKDWSEAGQEARAKFVIFLLGTGISLLVSVFICLFFGINISNFRK